MALCRLMTKKNSGSLGLLRDYSLPRCFFPLQYLEDAWHRSAGFNKILAIARFSSTSKHGSSTATLPPTLPLLLTTIIPHMICPLELLSLQLLGNSCLIVIHLPKQSSSPYLYPCPPLRKLCVQLLSSSLLSLLLFLVLFHVLLINLPLLLSVTPFLALFHITPITPIIPVPLILLFVLLSCK